MADMEQVGDDLWRTTYSWLGWSSWYKHAQSPQTAWDLSGLAVADYYSYTIL